MTWSTRLPVVMWPLPFTTLRTSGIKWVGKNCTIIVPFWRDPLMWVIHLHQTTIHLHISLVDHLQKCHFVHRHSVEEKWRANPLFSGGERLQSLWGGKGFLLCTEPKKLSLQLISWGSSLTSITKNFFLRCCSFSLMFVLFVTARHFILISFLFFLQFCIAMNNIEHVCECVKSVPHDFGISEDRASLSSTSSNIETTALDSFDHLLEFVITTVDQIDLAIYSALEPISKKVRLES